MSNLRNPGCMLRAASAMFGVIFLPVGLSFVFAFHQRHWMDGLGAIVAAVGFFYLAWRAPDLLDLDDVAPTTERSLAAFIAQARAAAPSEPPGPASTPDSQEPHP